MRERWEPVPGAGGLDGVLHALWALDPDEAVPTARRCGVRLCRSLVAAVRSGLAQGDGTGPDGDDAEFEGVLVRRLAERHVRTVSDHAAGAPVPRVWQLLLDAPVAAPARLALATGCALLEHDLALAFVGAATVLGRTPGAREHAVHERIAGLLARCVQELARRTGDADAPDATRLDDVMTWRAAWQRAAHLWTLRGRPAEAETARRSLDREVRKDAARLLFAC